MFQARPLTGESAAPIGACRAHPRLIRRAPDKQDKPHSSSAFKKPLPLQVDGSVVAEIISRRTGIPLGKMDDPPVCSGRPALCGGCALLGQCVGMSPLMRAVVPGLHGR